MKGKNVLVCISGGIAAYKTLFLIRLLVKHGVNVKVVVTKNALEFVTRLSLETLSGHEIYSDPFLPHTVSTEHIAIADWADLAVVAPATANILAKQAHGIADDALNTVLLALHEKPIFMAPAMNKQMYLHPATKNNMEILSARGIHLIQSGYGELACGTKGIGRMAEPEIIYQTLNHFLQQHNVLRGMEILITAGPTYEKIDPVRFIGNFSTGTMGFALAENLANKGANVTLVTGPTLLTTAHHLIHRIDVVSANEMHEAVAAHFPTSDIAILSAAVADYTPVEVAPEKIKKNEDTLTLKLKKTSDILADLGKKKTSGQILIGFALETHNEIENARNKLQKKGLDFIVLNSLQNKGAGFGTKTNQISIIHKNGTINTYELKTKTEVAEDIVQNLLSVMQ